MTFARKFDIRAQKGNPRLTQAERDAIAAYTGPVQIIPTGQSAFEYGEPQTKGWIQNAGQARRAAARAAQIAGMLAEGQTPLEIAEALYVPLQTVQNYMRRIEAEAKQ